MLGIHALALAAEPAEVRVTVLSELGIFPQRQAPASAVSSSESELSAEIAARVIDFPPRVGDVIARGDVVARLDCRQYQLELRASRARFGELKARLALATQRLERANALKARDALAAETVDERRAERDVLLAEIEGAEAAIALDEVAVDRCTVRSPFRALLLKRLAPKGQYAAAGDPVARVMDVEDIELSARVPTADVAAVMNASALVFRVDGDSYPVTPRRAVAAINTEARNQEIRLEFSDARPLPGAAGSLEWSDPRAHVPGSLLVRRDDRFGLFVVEDSRARFVAVDGAQPGRSTPVVLASGARIVVEGQFALRDGERVRIATPVAAPP